MLKIRRSDECDTVIHRRRMIANDREKVRRRLTAWRRQRDASGGGGGVRTTGSGGGSRSSKQIRPVNARCHFYLSSPRAWVRLETCPANKYLMRAAARPPWALPTDGNQMRGAQIMY